MINMHYNELLIANDKNWREFYLYQIRIPESV